MKNRTLKITTTLLIIFLIILSCKEPSIDLNPDSGDQLISSFLFSSSINTGFESDLEAEIQGSTIYFNLSSGTDSSSLIPSFELIGKGLQVDGIWQVSGSSVQNFSAPVFYDLIKTDNSRVQYTVVAGHGDNDSTSLKSFAFQAGLNAGLMVTVDGRIDGESIVFDFPFETNVQPLIPSFVTSGTAVVSYNGVVLNSDAAPLLNPANGGTLRVDFDDGTTKIYTVKTNVEVQKYIHVSNTGSAGASGSQNNPLNDIEEAISDAASKGIKEIRLAIGTYNLSTNLVIEDNLSIRGGYDSTDWSLRMYENPDIRNGTMCNIILTGGGSGTADEHKGSITYKGAAVGPNTILEGVRVSAMGGVENFTSAVTILDGASPTIQYTDLLGSSVSDGSALSVYNASPYIFSSQLLGDAGTYSVGLNVGSDGEPRVISSRISSYNLEAPLSSTGVALQLDGSGAGGWYYNNFIEGKGSTQGMAVKLNESGGSFINNIFSVAAGMPADICFLENGSGMRPDLLQNNNFSSYNLGVPLYVQDGSVLLEKAKEINALGYADSSSNSDYRFLNYYSYINDCLFVPSSTVPLTVAYKGQTLSSVWTRDLYNNLHNDNDGKSWSRGPVEVDYTVLGGGTITVTDPGGDLYDGIWNNLTLREAIHVCNTESDVNTIVYPSGSYTLNLIESLYISSDLKLMGSDGGLTVIGNGMDPHIIIDDKDSGSDKVIFLRNINFNSGGNAGSPEGGSIISREKLMVYNCIFSSNQAMKGGAIYQEGGELFIANTIFDQNNGSSGEGGAIYKVNSSLVGINMVFTGNQANGGSGNGSAIYMEESDAAITFCSFSTNAATGSGTVYGVNSDIHLLSSIFVNNTAAGLTDFDYSGGAYDLTASIIESPIYLDPPDTIQGPPGVFNTASPSGTDGIWKTSDDNLHSASNGELMYGFGLESHIITKWTDADGNEVTGEPFPYDLKMADRVQDGAPEAGAYEGVHVP
ncbi:MULTISPECIES: hypothetical protein [unclassified Oceanispirochaeta]|uniref:hypothetical protein n=1 Tax=unclassified Oceanispirochaeta TaxID=2635722 RepID=UPI000E092D89|nr:MULTISPECIES: hypothetical protein [unclassified Oceanispirochaeta]MBF9017105.1 hypothetical protein [Oceanispirochaeta sp. M2]NPD73554.1 hypothetical protein [Oceanispirochaeta sp. M1]RDG30659.1 hypothetical protein DV872_15770 [Oceanispirochaeta sp. M1]